MPCCWLHWLVSQVIPGTEQVALDILVFQPIMARAASTSAALPPVADLAVIAAGGSTGSGVSKRRANKSGGQQKGPSALTQLGGAAETERSTGEYDSTGYVQVYLPVCFCK